MEANDLIGDVLRKILGDPAEAQAYSEGPSDYLVAEGLGDIDLSGIDMGESIAEVANELSLDNDVTTTLIEVSEPVPAGPVLAPLAPAAAPVPAAAPAGGGGGGGSAPAAQAPAPTQITSLEQIQQVVNNYTTVVYEGDETITNNLFDNSQTLELDFEDVEGDIELEIDLSAVNANGPGAVAAGDDITDSQLVTGEGAVGIGGDNSGVVSTGENSGVIAGGDVDDTIIGDNNTQVGEAENVVSGDGNTINQVDGDDNVVQSGDGNENTQIDGDDATVIDSGGGEVTNTDIDASGDAEVNAVVGDANATVQGDENAAGFGSGDTANFGSDNDFGDAQIGFGGSTNQDNDIDQDNDTDIDQSTNIDIDQDIEDNSLNDSQNTDVEIETTIEDSFDTEDSFNTSEEFTADVEVIDSVDVDIDDVIDD